MHRATRQRARASLAAGAAGGGAALLGLGVRRTPAHLPAWWRPAPSIAVHVQRQIDANVAGVAFSASPVTGALDEVPVSAMPGLADTLVSAGAAVREAPNRTTDGASAGLWDERSEEALRFRVNRINKSAHHAAGEQHLVNVAEQPTGDLFRQTTQSRIL